MVTFVDVFLFRGTQYIHIGKYCYIIINRRMLLLLQESNLTKKKYQEGGENQHKAQVMMPDSLFSHVVL